MILYVVEICRHVVCVTPLKHVAKSAESMLARCPVEGMIVTEEMSVDGVDPPTHLDFAVNERVGPHEWSGPIKYERPKILRVEVTTELHSMHKELKRIILENFELNL